MPVVNDSDPRHCGTPQPPPDDDHALKPMLAVVHGLARFFDTPKYRPDVDLVAREWAPTTKGERLPADT